MGEGGSYWHQQIHAVMPDLEIRSLELHREGLVNDILIVNDRWVFRFTKTEWGKEQMALEGLLMDFLESRLSLPIPSPEITLDGVIVYQLIKGQEFTREVWQSADQSDQQNYAHQLGQFLSELHNIKQDSLDWEVPPTLAPVSFETWQEIYERVIEKVYPHLLSFQIDWVDSLFSRALNTPQFFDFEPVLIHGDLAPYHILYTPEEKRIKGVIDFGVAGMGDPATDLGSLLNYFGESLVSKLENSYSHLFEFLPRARFFAQAIELQWVLMGIESGDYYWFTAHIGGARDFQNP
jgi:aminoglycoside 2''-phosphotransferase